MAKKIDLTGKCLYPEDCAMGSMMMDDKKLLRKVDWHILPIMFLTYFLQMIDKISINVCIVQFPLIVGAKLNNHSTQMLWACKMT